MQSTTDSTPPTGRIDWHLEQGADGSSQWVILANDGVSPEYRTVRIFCVWAAVSENPMVTVEQMATALGFSPSTIWSDLQHLADCGYIERPSEGQRGFTVLVKALFADDPDWAVAG